MQKQNLKKLKNRIEFRELPEKSFPLNCHLNLAKRRHNRQWLCANVILYILCAFYGFAWQLRALPVPTENNHQNKNESRPTN